MFGLNVRRLSAALILAALLGLASPAVAVPPRWWPSSGVHGMRLLDQVAAWIARLWRGDEPEGPSPFAKEGHLIPGGGMLGGLSRNSTPADGD